MVCKSCKPICEPEITPVLYHLENLQKSKQKQFHVQCSVHKSYKTHKWINVHWKFWKKYVSVLHLFSCNWSGTFFATCYKNDSRFHQPASCLNIPAFAKFFAHQKDYIRLDYTRHISILSYWLYGQLKSFSPFVTQRQINTIIFLPFWS